jgi:hypothetical protein
MSAGATRSHMKSVPNTQWGKVVGSVAAGGAILIVLRSWHRSPTILLIRGTRRTEIEAVVDSTP